MTTLVRLDLGRPHQKYRNKAGEEVAGVTTKLRIYAKEQLYNWYGTEERAGIIRFMREYEAKNPPAGTWNAATLEMVLPVTNDGKPKLFAITKRDTAADTGTIAHAIIDARLEGNDLSPEGLDPEMFKQAQAVATRYLDKMAETPMQLVASELEMVSEKYQAGGTGDRFYRRPSGALVYRDLKTSGPWYDGYPYDEQFAQAAAYAAFYEEKYGERVEELWIDRTGKTASDRGDYYPMDEMQRALGLRLFERANEAYNDKWMLKQHNKSRRNGG